VRRSFEGASQHYWITRETWSPRFCPAFLTAGCHIFDIQHHYFICLDGARRSPGSFQATTTTSKSCRTATYSHRPLLAFCVCSATHHCVTNRMSPPLLLFGRQGAHRVAGCLCRHWCRRCSALASEGHYPRAIGAATRTRCRDRVRLQR